MRHYVSRIPVLCSHDLPHLSHLQSLVVPLPTFSSRAKEVSILYFFSHHDFYAVARTNDTFLSETNKTTGTSVKGLKPERH